MTNSSSKNEPKSGRPRGNSPRPKGSSVICTSVSATSCKSMARKAAAAFDLKTDLVELRMDHLSDPSLGQIRKTLSRFLPKSVVTVRPATEGGGFRGSEDERIELLLQLSRMGPAYVDVELNTLKASERLRESMSRERTIVSWHSLRGTPPTRTLKEVLSQASRLGRVTKIVTLAKEFADNLRVLSLYDGDPKGLVAFCMGERGIVSRVLTLRLSPLAYASLPGEPTAPGQLELPTMVELRGLIAGA